MIPDGARYVHNTQTRTTPRFSAGEYFLHAEHTEDDGMWQLTGFGVVSAAGDSICYEFRDGGWFDKMAPFGVANAVPGGLPGVRVEVRKWLVKTYGANIRFLDRYTMNEGRPEVHIISNSASDAEFVNAIAAGETELVVQFKSVGEMYRNEITIEGIKKGINRFFSPSSAAHAHDSSSSLNRALALAYAVRVARLDLV